MSEELNHPFTVWAKILEISGDQAVFKLPDGQTIKWEVSLMPPDAKAGDKIRIIIHDKETDEEERKRLARTLLNEIVAREN